MEDALKTSLPLMLVSGGGNNITTVLSGLIWLTLVNALIKNIPLILEICKGYFFRKVSPQINSVLNDNTLSKIIFERNYMGKSEDNLSDAIISYICSVDSAKELFFKDFYLANKRDVFEINSDISVRIVDVLFDKEVLSKVKLEIFSKTIKLSELRKWCETVYKEYTIEKKHKFGNSRFYFDQVQSDIPLDRQRVFHFSMTEFSTNKSLKNMYGDHINIVRERVKMFMERPDWYKDNGIPYTMGFLFHGPPGTGKTSTAKAIAKDTDRHIFNLRLTPDTSPDQLTNLFHNENVMVISSTGQPSSVIIPMNKRLYVIEDIDTLNDIVLDREFRKNEPEKEDENMKRILPRDQYDRMKKEKEGKKLTLGFILNLLDGILETPGRILIVTSNYPERLDKALIRPGRIDINLKLGFCTKSILSSMFAGFYGNNDFSFEFENIQITPAQVQEILCNNIGKPENAYLQIKELVCKSSENLTLCITEKPPEKPSEKPQGVSQKTIQSEKEIKYQNEADDADMLY